MTACSHMAHILFLLAFFHPFPYNGFTGIFILRIFLSFAAIAAYFPENQNKQRSEHVQYNCIRSFLWDRQLSCPGGGGCGAGASVYGNGGLSEQRGRGSQAEDTGGAAQHRDLSAAVQDYHQSVTGRPV